MVLSLTNIQGIDQLGAFKAIVPFAVGTVSVAYLASKAASHYYSDKGIPTVPFKDGASSHDKEYYQDREAFLMRCEEQYGPVFNVWLFNQFYTIVNGPELTREVFSREDLSASDALEQRTGLFSFFNSMKKSHLLDDNRTVHALVRELITPFIGIYTPGIVKNFDEQLDTQFGHCERTLVKDPLAILHRTVASAMACVFMGNEVGTQPQVVDTIVRSAFDMVEIMGRGQREEHWWNAFRTKAKYNYTSCMNKHIQVLADAATPVILQRRKEEAEQGEAYVRPHDVMQRLLDNNDKYNLVDIEDICGHLLILCLVSVHTTSDMATNALYYLAQYPQYTEKLYEETQEVLAEEAREIASAAEGADDSSVPRIIQPSEAMTAKAIKKMVHLDSFVRETFRLRNDLIGIPHLARQSLTLSNGTYIPKGRLVAPGLRSTHKEETLQGADPMEFRPWRFVGKGKSATKVGPDFLPFGMGKHGCPGRFIAIQEIKTIVCMMVSRFSEIEMEDPSKADGILHSLRGKPLITGLYFTSRQ